jgi:hypothetical protein
VFATYSVWSRSSYKLLLPVPVSHVPAEQTFCSCLTPTQAAPLPVCAGLSHALTRAWFPFPHVTEHALQERHWPQAPSASENIFILCFTNPDRKLTEVRGEVKNATENKYLGIKAGL